MNTTTLRDEMKTSLYDLAVSSFGSAVPSFPLLRAEYAY